MIPKSLHTVSSLVAVARHILATNPHGYDCKQALALAVEILGYADVPDVHGLLDVAARKLAK